MDLMQKAISLIPGFGFEGAGNAAALPGMGSSAISMQKAQDGGITRADTNVMVHKNEAIIPLDRFPEIVGQTVNVNQELVVDELKMLRSVLERMSRRGGLGAAIQGA